MADKPRQDLNARAFAFAERVLKLYPRVAAGGPARAHMTQQLFKAASSIGAQLEEGEVAKSRNDMAAKYAIAHRESRESTHWLRLLALEPQLTKDLAPLIQESPFALPSPFALCLLP